MAESQSGYVEKMDKHSTRKADAVRAVIRGLTSHVTGDAAPYMSDHFRGSEIPGQIGSVALPSDLRTEVQVAEFGHLFFED